MILKTRPITTTDRIITVAGKVFYNDRRRRIDVKKPIKDLFGNSSLKIGYIMELCLSEGKMLERVQELAKKDVIPVILYFTMEGDEE